MSSRHAGLDQDTAKLKVLRERLRKAHHLYLEPLEVALKCIDIRQVERFDILLTLIKLIVLTPPRPCQGLFPNTRGASESS